MKVISATLKKKKELEGTYLNGSVLEFILDSNGKYVCNIAVIEDLDFIDIRQTNCITTDRLQTNFRRQCLIDF